MLTVRMSETAGEKEVVIVPNDTGFDTVVSFWTERGMNISRLATKSIQDTVIENTPVSSDESAAYQMNKAYGNVNGIDKRELFTIINCVGSDNSTNIHQAFVHFYGTKKGAEIYKAMKKAKFYAPPVSWKREMKIQKFVELALQYCNTTHSQIPGDLIPFLCSSMTGNDNKKTIKKKITAQFGDYATSINNILSPHYNALAKIK